MSRHAVSSSLTAALVGVLTLTPTAAPAAGGGPATVLGNDGLTVAVTSLKRMDGGLLLTYTLINRGDHTVVLNTLVNEGIRRTPQVSVLDPATGVLGDRLGTPDDCRCATLPIGLGVGKALDATIMVADPGGATVDVVFSTFQPIHGVVVTGGQSSPTAVGTATATSQLSPTAPQTRQLHARLQDLQGRTKRGATRTQGSRIDLETDVLFAFDSAVLTSKAAANLRDAAARLRAQPGRRLAISGYTDSKGDPAYNLVLSRRRAAAVKQALAPLLGAGWTFDVKGLGETMPIAPNTTTSGGDNPKGRALNRRVELLPS